MSYAKDKEAASYVKSSATSYDKTVTFGGDMQVGASGHRLHAGDDLTPLH